MFKPDTIIHRLKASGKKQVLQKIADIVARDTHGDERVIMEQLMEREKLGSTGVGRGVAIPHARLSNISEVYSIAVTLDQSIDFDAVDEKPVDIIAAILAPQDAGADHLQALASVSRLLRDNKFCDKLRGAEDEDAIESLFLNYKKAKAA